MYINIQALLQQVQENKQKIWEIDEKTGKVLSLKGATSS